MRSENTVNSFTSVCVHYLFTILIHKKNKGSRCVLPFQDIVSCLNLSILPKLYLFLILFSSLLVTMWIVCLERKALGNLCFMKNKEMKWRYFYYFSLSFMYSVLYKTCTGCWRMKWWQWHFLSPAHKQMTWTCPYINCFCKLYCTVFLCDSTAANTIFRLSISISGRTFVKP